LILIQEELERERKITEVLERINLHDRGRSPLKRSGLDGLVSARVSLFKDIFFVILFAQS
jgi:hypothetical protein